MAFNLSKVLLTLARQAWESWDNRLDRFQRWCRHLVTSRRICSECAAHWFAQPPPGLQRRSTSPLHQRDSFLKILTKQNITWLHSIQFLNTEKLPFGRRLTQFLQNVCWNEIFQINQMRSVWVTVTYPARNNHRVGENIVAESAE